MSDDSANPILPTQIAVAVGSIPKALIPASIKALDRLVGAAVDIPAAWLAQQKARIDAKTQAYVLVEGAIAKAVASGAAADEGIIDRALDVLVRKEYRKQVNREAVAAALLEDLRTQEKQIVGGEDDPKAAPPLDVDDDWLNVFERYAEDASTERMQKLWGRVLSGEVRKPGRFSMRTLRFLSEFSQADALLFADFCKSSFGGLAPRSLVMPDGIEDITPLLSLEAAGLIAGVSGLGLEKSFTFSESGFAHLVEGNIAIQFNGNPGLRVKTPACILTPLGQELTYLLPERDLKEAGRNVAFAMRREITLAAYMVKVETDQTTYPMEVLWAPAAPTIDAAPS